MKKDPKAWTTAMRNQGTSKPDDFPVNNRAARRQEASKAGRKDLEAARLMQDKEVKVKR